MAGISLKRSRQAPAEETSAFGGVAERFRRAGDLDRAITLCREGLQRFPDLLSARVTLGWALLDKGEFEEAQVELQHVLRRAPDNLAAIRGLAELHDRVDSSGQMETWHPPAEPQPEPEQVHVQAESPVTPEAFEVPPVESVVTPAPVVAHVEAPAILSAAAAAIEAAGQSLPAEQLPALSALGAYSTPDLVQPAAIAAEEWNDIALPGHVTDEEVLNVEDLLAAAELAEALPAFDVPVPVELPLPPAAAAAAGPLIELVSPAAALFDTDVASVDAIALAAENPILSDYEDDDPRLLAELEQLAGNEMSEAAQTLTPVEPLLHAVAPRTGQKRTQVAALERFLRAVESRRLRLEAQSVA